MLVSFKFKKEAQQIYMYPKPLKNPIWQIFIYLNLI
jgi:hypothetical protein